MKNTTIANARAHRGFTLLELVMVLVIIGVILAMVGPRVFGNLGRANSERAKVQIEQIGGALELYKLDNGRYPTSSEGLDALMKSPSGAANWNGPYIKDLKPPFARIRISCRVRPCFRRRRLPCRRRRTR